MAMAIAACRSPTEPTSAGGAAWPNEPAGLSTLTDQPWNASTEGGWNRRESPHDAIVRDDTAPLSPSRVLEYVYPAGFGGGEAPATHYFALPRVRELFVGLQWQASAPWQGHSSGVNKVQFVYLDGSGDAAMVMYGPRGGPYDLRVLPQWREHDGRWLTPNAGAPSVAPGRWHRIEWHLRYETRHGAGDGIIRWWVDGVPAGSYTNVRYPDDGGFVEYQMSPTWGGVGDTKARTDFYRFDHTYLSVRAR
jgi:hypothetical protein